MTTHHDPEMEGAEHRGLLETMKMQNPEFAREAMTAHVTTAAPFENRRVRTRRSTP